MEVLPAEQRANAAVGCRDDLERGGFAVGEDVALGAGGAELAVVVDGGAIRVDEGLRDVYGVIGALGEGEDGEEASGFDGRGESLVLWAVECDGLVDVVGDVGGCVV